MQGWPDGAEGGLSDTAAIVLMLPRFGFFFSGGQWHRAPCERYLSVRGSVSFAK